MTSPSHHSRSAVANHAAIDRHAAMAHEGQTSGLVSSILADQTRARRVPGRPPLAVTLDVSQQHEQSLVADATLLRRALEPLIRRAVESAAQIDATRESPVVREVIVTSVDLGDAIEIEVADSGPALSDQVRKWLGETGRGPHDQSVMPEGTGLALAAVRAAVARIGGTLHAANCPDGGVAITLRLPRRQSQRLAA